MPVCTLHLISLPLETQIPVFLSSLRSAKLHPLLVARVIRWIVKPTILSVPNLLYTQFPWHLCILLPSDHSPFPPNLQSSISSLWSIQAGIPSRLLKDFRSRNHDLLHPPSSHSTTVPPLNSALSSPTLAPSSQSLELSTDLHGWIIGPASSDNLLHSNSTVVSMLNLLSFHSIEAKESYLQYGTSFARSIGSRHGGLAKIMGSVVTKPPPPPRQHPASSSQGTGSEQSAAGKVSGVGGSGGWDEIAIAQYPSIQHFGDMLASSDYQAVNQKYRLPSLRDTAILCMSEGAVEGMWEERLGEEGGGYVTGACKRSVYQGKL